LHLFRIPPVIPRWGISRPPPHQAVGRGRARPFLCSGPVRAPAFFPSALRQERSRVAASGFVQLHAPARADSRGSGHAGDHPSLSLARRDELQKVEQALREADFRPQAQTHRRYPEGDRQPGGDPGGEMEALIATRHKMGYMLNFDQESVLVLCKGELPLISFPFRFKSSRAGT
jgi:hypothetical protein